MGDALGQIIFHLPESWFPLDGGAVRPFYQRLFHELDAHAVAWDAQILRRETLMSQVQNDDHFHIVNHGRFEHPRILNCGVAYIYPFWNLDPQGIRAFSSIRTKRFAPDKIDHDVARLFFRKLRQRLVKKRQSRYQQPDATVQFPEGHVAIFLQSEAHRDVQEACYLDREDMVNGVLEATESPVVIKTHPRDWDADTFEFLHELSEKYPNLTITQANIHDILDKANYVVTINSAVGIEAYLHRKPVILCGQSDFQHIAMVAKTKAELAQSLARPKRPRAYDKFMYWYFAQECLSGTDPDLYQNFTQKLLRHGYDVSRGQSV